MKRARTIVMHAGAARLRTRALAAHVPTAAEIRSAAGASAHFAVSS
jgi:hypothetical protein